MCITFSNKTNFFNGDLFPKERFFIICELLKFSVVLYYILTYFTCWKLKEVRVIYLYEI